MLQRLRVAFCCKGLIKADRSSSAQTDGRMLACLHLYPTVVLCNNLTDAAAPELADDCPNPTKCNAIFCEP